jgi:hypothetical protein
MKGKFKEFGCEFKNESECEEEFDNEGFDMLESEEDYFEE